MRGRKPAGLEYVDGLAGSQQAKERVKAILGTMDGTYRVQEVCARLGISEPRFHQLRELALGAAVRELEPRPAGRPAQPGVPPEMRGLEEKVAALEVELQAARLRAELALALPQVGPVAEPEKKTRRRQASRRSAPRSPPPPPRNDT